MIANPLSYSPFLTPEIRSLSSLSNPERLVWLSYLTEKEAFEYQEEYPNNYRVSLHEINITNPSCLNRELAMKVCKNYRLVSLVVSANNINFEDLEIRISEKLDINVEQNFCRSLSFKKEGDDLFIPFELGVLDKQGGNEKLSVRPVRFVKVNDEEYSIWARLFLDWVRFINTNNIFNEERVLNSRFNFYQ